MTRLNMQKYIELVFWMAGAAISWQAVRYFNGEVQFPDLGRPDPSIALIDQFSMAVYLMLGMMSWVIAGFAVMLLGQTVARIYAVGSKQYLLEVRAARAKEHTEAKLIEDLFTRRESRRKKKQVIPDGDAIFALVAGLIIGSIFF